MNSFFVKIKSRKALLVLMLVIALSLISILFFTNPKGPPYIHGSHPWQEGKLFSRVDYRIFACDEELFLEASSDSPVGRGDGLYAESVSGSIIARGTPNTYGEASLSAFFDAIGGKLELPTGKIDAKVMSLPTMQGIREFQNGSLCGGQPAQLWVLHHRVDPSPQTSTVHPRVLWKYFDYSFRNNYGIVPPGDCLIFLFDSEDALNRPWPHCEAHDAAVVRGKLLFENPVY